MVLESATGSDEGKTDKQVTHTKTEVQNQSKGLSKEENVLFSVVLKPITS